MIPAKIDSISITPIREKGVESIADWFERDKQSFYILGWSYLRNQQQMEELFYRSIVKVHKELPRFKSESSLETWVTSIFIQLCRELASDNSLQASEESEQHKDFFQALDQLKEFEKDVIVLTYVKGFSQEEAAHLLQVSVGKIKEFLFSGIQSLRKEMGYESPYNGCQQYHEDYIDYLEGALDRPKKVDFEIHIYHCHDCQEDLATFQEVMLAMLNLTERIKDFHLPSDFMENVKARIAEKEKYRQLKNKKRKRMGIVLASIFALLVSIEVLTGSFTNLYYSWTEEDQELRAYLQQNLGERLNLEAENAGVKIKIKSAIADDVQTLIFYEIEDTAKNNQYMMNDHEGISVENEYEIMNSNANQMYYPPDLKSDKNNKEKNVYQGKISLLPLSKEKGTIKLKITKLQKLIGDPSVQNSLRAYENTEYETGEWSFEIPVTRKPSIEYALDQETEVEGVPVRFDKLTIAPTATILQYSIRHAQSGKRIDFLNFDNLEVNNKRVKADLYGSSFLESPQDMNWSKFQAHFNPLFGEKPKEVTAQFGSIYLTIEDPKTIILDAAQEYPQTFEYAGSTISIDKVEVGLPSKVVISNRNIEKRAYESLQFAIMGEGENATSSMEMNSEGVLVDKNGTEYDMNINPVPYEEIEQPRYLLTVQGLELRSDKAGEIVVPTRLEIYGYNTTKYIDDVVKISLE